MNRDQVPVQDPEVLWRVLQEEVVIVRPASGEIRVLNAVGALIWRCADGKRTVADLAREVSSRYAVSYDDAQLDVAAFIGELVAEGWLFLIPNPESP
jgi:hypothetical protein